MSMFCENCGKEVEETWNQCPYCSHPLKDNSNVKVAEQDETVNQTTADKLVFRKTKMIGLMTYSSVDTKITIEGQSVHFHQTISKILRSIKKVEVSFHLSEISEIGIKTKMDFWDTLYGVIFVFLGIFINPLIFLLAVVCLYCGYGKIIQISTVNGKKYTIPSALKTDDVQKLLDLVNGGDRALNN